jgi:hypothetical protein
MQHDVDLVAARRGILDALARVRGQAVCERSPRTIRDVVQTRTSTHRCVLGPLTSTVHLESAKIRNQRQACSGGKCPHCIDHYVVKFMLRALRLWKFQRHVYRATFPAESWRNRPAERFRREHPLHVWVLVDDTRVVLSPEPFEGSEQVNAAAALFEALLSSPCAGQRRYGFAYSAERREREAADAEPKPPTRISTRVSRDYTLEGLANRYSVGIGRALLWQTEHGDRGSAFSAADTADVTEDEVPKAVEVVQALKSEYKEERRRDKEAREMAKYVVARLAEGAEGDIVQILFERTEQTVAVSATRA